MKLILDTHIIIRLVNGDTSIDPAIVRLIDDQSNQKYVSAVSLWEIAIKVSIGKLKMGGTISQIEKLLSNNGISLIDIKSSHLEQLITLPFIHKDPFDRLIITQAIVEKLQIITDDQFIVKYPNLSVISL
jgi:PIN domain nuclease of toxin-antitoxin system